MAVAANRQDRPQMPQNWCPFDPGSGRVPDHYDVYLYPNDFPAFSEEYPPFSPETALFHATGARGTQDVVLYSPDHNLQPSQLTAEQWLKVIGLWTRRSNELFAIDDVEHVQVFENTGVAIGVTMPHPHGQIYGFPFLPPFIETELQSASDYEKEKKRCIYCDILSHELEDGAGSFRRTAASSHFCHFLGVFQRKCRSAHGGIFRSSPI